MEVFRLGETRDSIASGVISFCRGCESLAVGAFEPACRQSFSISCFICHKSGPTVSASKANVDGEIIASCLRTSALIHWVNWGRSKSGNSVTCPIFLIFLKRAVLESAFFRSKNTVMQCSGMVSSLSDNFFSSSVPASVKKLFMITSFLSQRKGSVFTDSMMLATVVSSPSRISVPSSSYFSLNFLSQVSAC